MTLPLIHTLRYCNAEERQRVAEIVEQEEGELGEEEIAFVVDLIERCDGIGYTRRRAQELVEKAKVCLASFPDSVEKTALFELADYVVSRRK